MASMLVAEDLSAVGGISLSAAVPVLAAFDYQVAALPTSLLSTHTSGYGRPAILSLADWLPQVFEHWTVAQLQFQQALIGYVGSVELCDLLTAYLRDAQLQLIVVDPVLGDLGKLYAGFDAAYVDAMRRMLTVADVILPNVTEASLLTGVPYQAEPDLARLLTELQQQLKLGAHAIMTGVTQADQIGCAWLVDGQVQFVGQPRLAGHYNGTGDALAAVLAGLLGQGRDLAMSIQLANQWLQAAVAATLALPDHDERQGIQLRPILRAILALDPA
ncbi:PfkB family carbohydrate kinase [Lactiplantibacillus mudanjiangensis]|uniref:pyridoxal kinase n=1 Tax=Lactiplantibacillus mudanjiangensis TaxID=1296538 RepID=A0A660DYT2_9LACO|nr:PfkB family carbohydrate kinase [Lactiplantibacillus mudanjiangensis]VDG23286.1 pyridoxine kinase [Lactobacillus pentosus] [Lactiplantibacillus mudanjiangensis]VDG28247.1 pyridoxine kinase [Lactobacillus pentosus] [Lactiplantibacillus mudanjiangensis]VDG32462.1 pyridoxine kinase [Lactobacillus pentosus] [Lactiplantibacillus mudanjiangensis]